MKLATYHDGDGAAKVGVVDVRNGLIVDLPAAARRMGDDAAPFASMLDLIDAGDAGLDRAREVTASVAGDEELCARLDAVRLMAPVPIPRQIRDASLFALHLRQGGKMIARQRAEREGDTAEIARIDAAPLPDLPPIYRDIPIYYISNRFSVRGHDDDVRWPRYSTVMDYELEFGVFTKGQGANIKASDASTRIFGFTVFNDFSARDIQSREMLGSLGPTKGKSFDGGNVIGPWIVTPDELGDPYSLKGEARVNGETWSEGTTSDMLFSFEELLEYVSRDETIMAGEFLGSGTLGNGCGLEQGRFLSSGDIVELEFEKIGVLRNRVVSQ